MSGAIRASRCYPTRPSIVRQADTGFLHALFAPSRRFPGILGARQWSARAIRARSFSQNLLRDAAPVRVMLLGGWPPQPSLVLA